MVQNLLYKGLGAQNNHFCGFKGHATPGIVQKLEFD